MRKVKKLYCTSGIWERFDDTMIIRWEECPEEYDDLYVLRHSTEDVKKNIIAYQKHKRL